MRRDVRSSKIILNRCALRRHRINKVSNFRDDNSSSIIYKCMRGKHCKFIRVFVKALLCKLRRKLFKISKKEKSDSR